MAESPQVENQQFHNHPLCALQGGGGPCLESPEEEAALEVSLPWLRPVAALLATYSYSCTHQVHRSHIWRAQIS